MDNPARLVPPEKFAHPLSQDLLELARSVENSEIIELHSGDREPGARLNSSGQKWIAAALRYFAKHGPCDPNAVTLDEGDEALIELVARAIWETYQKSPIVTQGSKDTPWDTLTKWATKNPMIADIHQTAIDESRAVIRAIKETKR